MIIVSEILHKYNISMEQVAKMFGYRDANSLRNSKNYPKVLQTAEDLVILAERNIKETILKAIE